MKKLYKKGTVHPTPPHTSDHLSFLPATIFTLTAALSSQDREVLAYLLSCSSNNYAANNTFTTTTTHKNSTAVTTSDHPTSFNCGCFRCYMNYWVRWDASPNRQLIHEIIDAFEEGLAMQGKKEKSSRRERRKGRSSRVSTELSKDDVRLPSDSAEDTSASSTAGGGDDGGENGGGEEEELQKGSVRKFVNFLGEKIWGVWN